MDNTNDTKGKKSSPLEGEDLGEGYNTSHRFYSKKIKEYARNLRKQSTKQELKLWGILKNSATGYKFRRQHQFNNKYIADFVCLEKNLIIEIDGGQHNGSFYDIERTFYLNDLGFNVIRFWNNEIENNIEACYDYIIDKLNNSLLPLTPTLTSQKTLNGSAFLRQSLKGRGRLLLTGSGGFIGKNLKSYLQGKYNLLTPRSYELDLTDTKAVADYFKNNNVDFIIHCGSTGGARGVADKDTTIEDNLAMVDNLLNHKKDNVRVILFGSGAMYGKTRNLHKVKEEEIGKFVPEDLYGKSKMLIAQKIKDRDDVLCLNIFACYGYGEKESRFPSYAINRTLEGKTIEINQNCIFDYLFVEDMQRIVSYFIENKPKDNIINITPSESISLYEIAQIVSEGKVDIKIKNPVMNNEYTGDNSRLLENIKGFEFTPIEKGLKLLWEYNKRSLYEYS